VGIVGSIVPARAAVTRQLCLAVAHGPTVANALGRVN
jgi:hypothetical protein